MKVVQIDPPVVKKDVQLTLTAEEATSILDYFCGTGKRRCGRCQEWARTATISCSKAMATFAAELEKLGY